MRPFRVQQCRFFGRTSEGVYAESEFISGKIFAINLFSPFYKESGCFPYSKVCCEIHCFFRYPVAVSVCANKLDFRSMKNVNVVHGLY